MIVENEKINSLEFNDFIIESMHLNFRSKNFVIKTDGAYLVLGKETFELKNGIIKIFNWENITFSDVDDINKTHIRTQLNENNYDAEDILEEINLWEYSNKKLAFGGYGKKDWILFEIDSPEIEITFSDIFNRRTW